MSHFSTQWCGHNLTSYLYIPHASKNDSPSFYLKQVIWFLNCVVLLSKKYRVRNITFNSFHIIMKSDGRDRSHSLALSSKKIGKSLILIVIWSVPFIFRVSQNSTKTNKCKLGSSINAIKIWFRCTMDNK